MGYVIAIVISLLVGFVSGVLLGHNVAEEFDELKSWAMVELTKLHQKLDSIFVAVKK